MFETLVILKPHERWRRKNTWYSSWSPHWLLPTLRHFTPDYITVQELISEMNQSLRLPGLSNSWTMPIRGRVEMLATGIRTPVGLKLQGPDLGRIEQLGRQLETVLRGVAGTSSVFAERTNNGYFLEITWDRRALARYGISIEDAQSTLATAVGGENVSTAIAGRERYPINVRYMRDFRSDLDALGKVLVSVNGTQQVPLAELATVKTVNGPSMIRDENGLLTGYVYIDVQGRTTADYVAGAQRALQNLPLPDGYLLTWSGEYETAQRVRRRLWLAVPLTLVIIGALLYSNTRSFTKTMIVILAVPFSAVGALWLVYVLGYSISTAVWIGLIALLGIDAETGVFMLLYLELAYTKAKREAGELTAARLTEAVVEGSAKRLRPKLMTFTTMSIGLIPVLWANGAGSEIMKRIAAPMVGGIVTSFLLELLVYPAVFALWKES